MQEILGIRKKEYIQVQEGSGMSYGGSQLFFKPLPDKRSQGKYNGGCGMIALGDLLLYLMDKEGKTCTLNGITYHPVFERKEAYMAYFDELCRKLKWFPSRNGMSGVLMAIRFNYMMHKYHLPYRARWGLLESVREGRIERMLQRDIPVILCIPRVLPPFGKNDRLSLYREQEGKMKQVDKTRAHYVMITGMERNKNTGRVYYRVSSWGRQYDISVEEYRKFVRTHLLGTVLGNILYISC